MKKLITLLLVCCWSLTLFSQQDTLRPIRKQAICEVHLKDGTIYTGYIERQNDSLIVLKASSGVYIQIPKDNVSGVEILKVHNKNDSLDLKHPSTFVPIGKRYYVVCSNALLFDPKKVFITSYDLVFYNINYALNKNFCLGLSSSIIGTPLVASIKANFEVHEKMYLGFEGSIGDAMYLGPKTYGSGGAIKLTLGKDQKSLTFYGGFGDLEIWIQSRRRGRGRSSAHKSYYERVTSPFAGIAGSLPFTKNLMAIGECFVFPNVAVYTASAAIRTIGKQKISLVAGIQLVGGINAYLNKNYSFPYFGFSAAL